MKILKKKNSISSYAKSIIENIKLNNIDNEFFSENDFIVIAEKEKNNFLKNKNSFLYKCIYKTLDSVGIIDEKELNETFENFIDQEIYKNLEKTIQIKELNRLYELYKLNKMNLDFRNFEIITKSEDLLFYVYKKKKFKKDFFIYLVKELKTNKKFKDLETSEKYVLIMNKLIRE